ncbi:hypothetical protein RRG08_047294 [Elysia crispata]|uniref:Uncharacterized protein n=1 Tax=Elysia crispata TaxID=231223 RepID=A0AAE1DDQ1_9GAST|nr:hypothetical protein RRG08_047294 [Elysia crispata]
MHRWESECFKMALTWTVRLYKHAQRAAVTLFAQRLPSLPRLMFLSLFVLLRLSKSPAENVPLEMGSAF